jgi:hypothetical protein
VLGIGGSGQHVAIPACACDRDPMRTIEPPRARPIGGACAREQDRARPRSGQHAHGVITACACDEARVRIKRSLHAHGTVPWDACSPSSMRMRSGPIALLQAAACLSEWVSMRPLPRRDAHAALS